VQQDRLEDVNAPVPHTALSVVDPVRPTPLSLKCAVSVRRHFRSVSRKDLRHDPPHTLQSTEFRSRLVGVRRVNLCDEMKLDVSRCSSSTVSRALRAGMLSRRNITLSTSKNI